MKVVVLGLVLVACGSSQNSTADDAQTSDATTSDAMDSPVDSAPFGSSETYLKASPGDVDDLFGYSLSLSGDGQTLAVGAFFEDSAAVGIDGDRTDNTAPNSGAVYVYTRANDAWDLEAYVKASNVNEHARFGFHVQLSTDGNTLAVGAPDETSCATGVNNPSVDLTCGFAGAVYVFVRTNGTWSQEAYVKASNTRTGNSFGHEVALSGDGATLAVGQPGDSSNASGIDGDGSNNLSTRSGAVLVFVKSGNTWSQQAYVKAATNEQEDAFGVSIALSTSGNVMAIGASQEDGGIGGVGGSQLDNSARDAGAAFIFSRTNTTWTQDTYVKASNPHQNYAFGQDLALSGSGDTLAVGSYGEASNATGINGNQNDTSESQAGAVYAFAKTATGWEQQAYIKEDVSHNVDMFGSSVSLSSTGDLLAAGAIMEQRPTPPTQVGGVYVFRRSGGTWAREFHTFASNAERDDLFGNVVSLSNDGTTLAVGAPNEDGTPGAPSSNAVPGSGAVYVIQ